MEEIIYRAKRLDNGEWVHCGTIMQFYDDGVKSFYMPNLNEKCIASYEEETGNIIGLYNTSFYKVDPLTIEWYIGRNDEKGNKIFKGDIVKFVDNLICNDEDERVGVVDFKESLYMIKTDLYNYYLWMDYIVEVIGNVYDNPELLKGEPK